MKPGFQRGQNDVLQLIGEIGRVKQAERGAAENVSLLGLLQFFADESGALQADLHGGVAAAFQPFDQLRDLRGAAGAVRAFHHDQFAGELFQSTPGMPCP